MKKSLFIILIVLLNIIFTACGSGSSGEIENKELYLLDLILDKDSIIADGTDKVYLSVKGYDEDGEEIEVENPEYYYVENESNIKISENYFYSEIPGDYTLFAKSGDIQSESKIVKVLEKESYKEEIEIVYEWLTFDIIRLNNESVEDINSNMYFPIEKDGININWNVEEGSEGLINFETGEIVRPIGNDEVVKIRALLSQEEETREIIFELKIKGISNNNFLESLVITDYVLNPEFNREIFEYNITVNVNTAVIEIDALAEDDNAVVTGCGIIEINDIEKISIKVISEYGEEKEYAINIKREELILTKLELKSDKESITANGSDKAVFQIDGYDQYNNKLNNIEYEIYKNDEKYNIAEFSTEIFGEYEFYALSGEIKSNTVTISAIEYINVSRVEIYPDKYEIWADNADTVNFTVNVYDLEGNILQDVTAKIYMNQTEYNEKSFKTNKDGNYVFYAEYKGIKSDEISINVKALSYLYNIKLESDKLEIKADGIETVTFTATGYDQYGEVYTGKTLIIYVNDIAMTGNTFKTNTAGIYTVKAKYGMLSSRELTITAISVEPRIVLSDVSNVKKGEEFEVYISGENFVEEGNGLQITLSFDTNYIDVPDPDNPLDAATPLGVFATEGLQLPVSQVPGEISIANSTGYPENFNTDLYKVKFVAKQDTGSTEISIKVLKISSSDNLRWLLIDYTDKGIITFIK